MSPYNPHPKKPTFVSSDILPGDIRDEIYQWNERQIEQNGRGAFPHTLRKMEYDLRMKEIYEADINHEPLPKFTNREGLDFKRDSTGRVIGTIEKPTQTKQSITQPSEEEPNEEEQNQPEETIDIPIEDPESILQKEESIIKGENQIETNKKKRSKPTKPKPTIEAKMEPNKPLIQEEVEPEEDPTDSNESEPSIENQGPTIRPEDKLQTRLNSENINLAQQDENIRLRELNQTLEQRLHELRSEVESMKTNSVTITLSKLDTKVTLLRSSLSIKISAYGKVKTQLKETLSHATKVFDYMESNRARPFAFVSAVETGAKSVHSNCIGLLHALESFERDLEEVEALMLELSKIGKGDD